MFQWRRSLGTSWGAFRTSPPCELKKDAVIHQETRAARVEFIEQWGFTFSYLRLWRTEWMSRNLDFSKCSLTSLRDPKNTIYLLYKGGMCRSLSSWHGRSRGVFSVTCGLGCCMLKLNVECIVNIINICILGRYNVLCYMNAVINNPGNDVIGLCMLVFTKEMREANNPMLASPAVSRQNTA